MASNLTGQVRNIAQVATAVARGDLSQKITVAAQGEILELKDTVNTMVDQLSSFADEVTRVAREVGTEGKLGGQAQVPGVSGTWRDLTENVNQLAGNLTAQVRNIAQVDHGGGPGRPVAEDHGRRPRRDPGAEEHRQHDGGPAVRRSPTRSPGWPARSARRASSAVRPRCAGVAGTWRDLTDNVNFMASNLTVAGPQHRAGRHGGGSGDLSQKITVDARGEILELKSTVNTMVDQLSVVRRRGHPGGPRGRHRRQARRPGAGARASPAPGATSPTT